MTEKLKKLLEGDTIVTLLLWGALIVYATHILMALPALFALILKAPITAVLGFVLTAVKAIYQPVIMLGVAKLISMKRAAANA